MWPFRRREREPEWSLTDVRWPDAPPEGFRWRTRLIVTGRRREGGVTEILMTVPEVLDAEIHPSGLWVTYTLPGPEGSRETTGWWRIPDHADNVKFQRHHEPVPKETPR